MSHASLDANNDGIADYDYGGLGDFSDPMGAVDEELSNYKCFHAVHRLEMNWLSDVNVIEPASDEAVTLSACSNRHCGSAGMAVLARFDIPGSTDSYWVSLRTRIGAYDGSLSDGWHDVVYLHRWARGAHVNTMLVARVAAGQVFTDALGLSLTVSRIDFASRTASIIVHQESMAVVNTFTCDPYSFDGGSFSAESLYSSCAVVLRKGCMYTFSACGNFDGDPFLRLFDPSGAQQAENDDYCDRGSQLSYTAATDGTFSLHEGCWSSMSCSATITVTSFGEACPFTALSPSASPVPASPSPTPSATHPNTGSSTFVCAPFRFNTGSGSAEDMYSVCEVPLYAGCTYTFSTCHPLHRHYHGLTVVRLLDDSGVEVSVDNYALCANRAGVSYSYTVPTQSTSVVTYTLREGCWSNSMCYGTTTVTSSGAPGCSYFPAPSCTHDTPSLQVADPTPLLVNDCTSGKLQQLTIGLNNHNEGTCAPASFEVDLTSLPPGWRMPPCIDFDLNIVPDAYRDEISWQVREFVDI